MGGKTALAAIIGRGDEKRMADEVARGVDWLKVRRVQHRLSRPPQSHGGSNCGFLSYEELVIAEARRRRAMRLAHILAFVDGVLLGFAFLRGLTSEPLLLFASFCIAFAGILSANRACS